MAQIPIILANGQQAGETLKQLSNQAAALRKELAGLKPGTEEFVKTAGSLNQVNDKLGDIRKQAASVSEASNTMKSSFMGVLNQIPGFSQISGALNSARGGVGGLTSGFGLLRGAIIATGIGALVIAVTALVGWFSKTETGANMIGGAFKAMGAVVDTLMGKLWNIGNTLKELFSNPIQFFKNLGNDIVNSAKEGYNFVQMMDAIEDKQRDMEVTAKQNDILVDQLLLQAKNVGKTYEERLALLNKANDITRKTYQEQLALSKEYLDAVEKEVQAELKRQGQTEMTDEQADKIKDAKLKYLDLLGQEIQTEEKIANRREQILGKQEKAQEKANAQQEKDDAKKAAALQKQLDDEEKARLNILELRASDQEKGLQMEIDQINASTQKKIEALVGSEAQIAEQKALLTDISERQIAEIKEKYRQQDLQKEYEKDIKQNDLDLITAQNGLTQQYQAGLLTQQQYVALSEQNVKDSEQRKLDIIKSKFGETSLEYQNQFKKILELNKEHAEVTAKMIAQSVGQTAGSLANIFGGLASLQNEGSQEAKDLQVAQAEMAAIQGAMNAYTSTLNIPFVGAFLAPIAAAVALAVGLKNVDKIKNTPLPKKDTNKSLKAETGGLLVGPLHSNGGIPLEAEGGEFIFSRAAVAGIGVTRLAAMNNRFAAGGPVNPFQDRGPIASGAASASSSSNDIIDYAKLAAALSAHVDDKIARIEVVNDVSKTKKGIDTLNKLSSDGDV